MITVSDLSFSYTKEPYIEQMNFRVKNKEIFGFLGPSGAGKSTLQKILTGLLLTYKGSAVVSGTEVKRHNVDFFEKIGVVFEFPSLYEKLTARQNLTFFGSLYKKKPHDVDALLDAVGLLRDADKKAGSFSKGMKSRLNFIKALIHDPDILFLDEPTSGLDPSNARIMKDLILEEQRKGKTIILTTHNMQDAAELCSRVAFIVDGTIKALDTPRNLIMKKGASVITYTWIENGKERTGRCKLNVSGSDNKLRQLISDGKLRTIHTSEPTLNNIFIEVTGRALV